MDFALTPLSTCGLCFASFFSLPPISPLYRAYFGMAKRPRNTKLTVVMVRKLQKGKKRKKVFILSTHDLGTGGIVFFHATLQVLQGISRATQKWRLSSLVVHLFRCYCRRRTGAPNTHTSQSLDWPSGCCVSACICEVSIVTAGERQGSGMRAKIKKTRISHVVSLSLVRGPHAIMQYGDDTVERYVARGSCLLWHTSRRNGSGEEKKEARDNVESQGSHCLKTSFLISSFLLLLTLFLCSALLSLGPPLPRTRTPSLSLSFVDSNQRSRA